MGEHWEGHPQLTPLPLCVSTVLALSSSWPLLSAGAQCVLPAVCHMRAIKHSVLAQQLETNRDKAAVQVAILVGMFV